MANAANVWDGTKWVDTTPQVYVGGSWEPEPPLYWDNHEWMSAAPTATEFPVYEGGVASKFGATGTISCAVPAAVRTNDFVVSVMAQQDGEDRSPRLLTPAGVIPTLYTLPSGVRLYVAVWPWEPSQGPQVIWDVAGSDNTACMNMIYRFGDITNTSLTPVVSMTSSSNVMSVPLPASSDFTNVYVVLTVADTLTGTAWPSGVSPRNSVLGTFGTKAISLVAADTPGAGASPGSIALDTTVDTAVVALIQIPGKSDGKPTWVLNSSVLGTTTVLG